MWADIAAIYRASLKKNDVNWFTTRIARPPAAVVVYALRNTRVTPNQVTFLAALVAAAAGALLVAWPGWLGLGVAVAVYEFSFVLDCADGMLARLRKVASPIGHLLDFLMDELKAMLVYGCVAVRLWRATGDERLLIVGLAGLFALAAGISLTTFTRRAEYTGPGTAAVPDPDRSAGPPQPAASPPEGTEPGSLRDPDGGAAKVDDDDAPGARRRGPVGMAIGGLEWAARFVVHYPQYIWACAAANRIDVYFWAYGAVNVLYLGLTMLKILRKLGRVAPRAASAPAEAPAAAAARSGEP
ncbi:MAG TPA: CDP-alcohol phosphatidyltransferase family protein [Kofleriaceae bacterium]|nr:CDP-alcohol phosphatidyltransferase family protein [Kofleriaceae bacterium]